MAGTGLYWARGEDELRALAEALEIPVFLNGMGRGCLPADHELYFSRARGQGLKEADVALVVGVPLDFRLAFGGSFGEETRIVSLDAAPSKLAATRQPEIELVGDIPATLAALRETAASPEGERGRGANPWLAALRETESEKRESEVSELTDDRAPLHPVRIYAELNDLLDRDAIVIGDGGDFVSYAGRFIKTYEPGCLDGPGPVRLPRGGPGPGDRRRDGPSRSPDLPPPRRRRIRVLRAWSSTRWPATAFPSSGSSATTASGRSSTTR